MYCTRWTTELLLLFQPQSGHFGKFQRVLHVTQHYKLIVTYLKRFYTLTNCGVHFKSRMYDQAEIGCHTSSTIPSSQSGLERVREDQRNGYPIYLLKLYDQSP